MKRVWSLFLALIIILSFASCAEKAPSNAEVDIDLTTMSGTMVYSKVYDMVSNKQDYAGKTVKMKGNFAVYGRTQYREHYFACVIADATACCQQGLEFTLKNGASYPGDYPDEGQEVTVTGTFTVYKEGQDEFIELRNSTIEY